MDHLQKQCSTQPPSLDDDVEKGIHGPNMQYFPSDFYLPPLYGKQEVSTIEEPGKVMKTTVLTGKYTKYAGGPPDGGLKAWSVILGASFTAFAAFGYVTSWGIFQAYYEEVTLRDQSPSSIAWIGSMQTAMIFIPGLITGRLFDIGYFKMPYFLASCSLILCTFLVAECKVYWQFFLVQGLGVGLACGFLFGPAVGVIPHWFSKRRGVAMGISAVGSSVGGMVFPIAAQSLISKVGFGWTMRIFGFILTVLLGIGFLTIDRRLPPVNVKGGLFNWAAFKSPAYAVYCISGVTAFLGMYTMLMFIPISAVQAGISNDFAFYLSAISNVTSVLGRISAGFLGDRLGALNIIIPFTIAVATATVVWPLMTSQGALIGVAVIYSLGYGSYITLVCAPVMAMGSTNDVGRRIGMFMSLVGFGALAGTPISGAINSATKGYECVGWYAGGMLFFSVCLLLLARYLHLGKWMGKF